MWLGIEQGEVRARHFGDIGARDPAPCARTFGYSVVREFCGHGIGKVFHEEPQVLHYGLRGTGEVMRPGMVFTIEPMINAGRAEPTDVVFVDPEAASPESFMARNAGLGSGA